MGFDRQVSAELAQLSAQDGSHMDAGSHYGLANIDQRIKLLYGDGYGLQLESRVGEGTTVSIRLPKKRIDEMDDAPSLT